MNPPGCTKESVFYDNKVKVPFGREQCNSFDSSPKSHLSARFHCWRSIGCRPGPLLGALHVLEQCVRVCPFILPACSH